jgi:hypothetical protein
MKLFQMTNSSLQNPSHFPCPYLPKARLSNSLYDGCGWHVAEITQSLGKSDKKKKNLK